MKNFIVRLLIAMLIILVSIAVILLIKPYLPFVPEEVWDSLDVSFGFAYIFFNPKDLGAKDKKSAVILYFIVGIVLTILGTVLNYIF